MKFYIIQPNYVKFLENWGPKPLISFSTTYFIQNFNAKSFNTTNLSKINLVVQFNFNWGPIAFEFYLKPPTTNLDEEMLCKCFDKCSKALAINTG